FLSSSAALKEERLDVELNLVGEYGLSKKRELSRFKMLESTVNVARMLLILL
ncbi:hypothetical protein Leryth_021824, partial [Lithospermum erythrorhizon]